MDTTSLTAPLIGELIDELSVVYRRFGQKLLRQKTALLLKTARYSPRSVKQLKEYHNILLFLVAYPDSKDLRRLAENELKRLAAICFDYRQRALASKLEQLKNSGIFASDLEYQFALPIAQWLSKSFPQNVTLAWEEGFAGDKLEELLQPLLPRVTHDVLSSGRRSTEELFSLVGGRLANTKLSWLISGLEKQYPNNATREQLYNNSETIVRWKLVDKEASRTFIRAPFKRVFYHTRPQLRNISPLALISKTLPSVKQLTSASARELINVARASLAVRQRETEPVTYANPREITLVHLERGIDLALYGMLPAKRLPIESFFGYLAIKNGIPVAYGGGWIFLDRADIGINIFEEFRGGESAYLFSQIIRAYHQLFSIKRFRVDSYQFGGDNQEGLASGAFWFYYRLGFRPEQAKLAELAESEWQTISKTKGYRSPLSKLRRLTESKLTLELSNRTQASKVAPELSLLGQAVLRLIGTRFKGDREAAEQWAINHVRKALNVKGFRDWSELEQTAFTQLSLLAAQIPGLANWSVRDKRSLSSLMRAKGQSKEALYVKRLRCHARFREAMYEIAACEGNLSCQD